MGNWENIIKTYKYKFIYLPSFPLLFEKPVKLEIARRVAKQGGPACGVPIYGFTGFERSGLSCLFIDKLLLSIVFI